MTTVFRVARFIRTIVKGNSVMDVFLKCGLLFLLGAFLSFYLGWSCLATTLTVFAVYLVTGGWRFAKVVCFTIKRDLRALHVLLTMKWNVRKYHRTGSSIPKLFKATADKYPKKTCFIFEDKSWTFQEVDQYSNAIANYFYEAGIRQGNVVAIFMENHPNLVFYWLGLAKIGAVGALVNYNLRDKPLLHCLEAANAQAFVFGSEMTGAVRDVVGDLSQGTQLYMTGQGPVEGLRAVLLDPLLEKSPTYPPPTPTGIKFTGRLFYVYTSGTTGLPKAAIISHSRFYYMSFAVNRFMELESGDVLYDPLPLYHTAGGIIGVGQAFLRGTTVVVKKKFSASRFWDDCVQHNCTAAQYIGEICRYLMAQPHRAAETQHKVRIMFGNGLQKAIWEDFQKRFGVKIMGEFYGATEGNCNIINYDNTIGAVGFKSMILPFVYPVTLIKVDKDTNEIVRDKNGVCVKAKPGEPGELVGKIVTGDPFREFDGYVNKQATEKKTARDVFRKGDMAFLTGDILIMDWKGYMYFRDRTGDTFRWRGENVSTTEVETAISKIVKLQDAVVYGVEVPGTEGRAGMAAIVDENENLDLSQLNAALQRTLPPYARPLFIRLIKEADLTGTFKLKKTTLRDEGINPNVVKDRLFYMNSKTGQYESLTDIVYRGICDGKIRL